MTPARFDGRRVAVTGAGSGIGRATARRFCAEGATVLGIDRERPGLEETFAGYPTATMTAVDVRSHDALATLERFGAADVLVNAAGILRRAGVLEHSLADWQDTLDVNLKAPFRLSRQFARDHVARKASGVIVNVCSIESFNAGYRHVAYTASKTALLMLTRALAYDLAPHAIRVTGVAPGMTETGMNADIRADPANAKRLTDLVPLRRFGKPEEIAAGICFLASDEAGYTTGTVILIDGGWHLY
jgi:NAD(P)-dependent dehydrogenase (short-subunit alcohol dehydrogenase family)